MLRKIYLRGVVAVLLIAALAQTGHTQLKPVQASPVLVQSKPTPAPTQIQPKAAQASPVLVQPKPAESAVAFTVAPELYWHSQREAEAMLGQARLQFKVSGEGPIVVDQQPGPRTQMPVGASVAIVLGQPQLLLAAEPVKADINKDVAFTANLEPPLPKATPVTIYAYVPPRLQASYTYFWGDNLQTGPTDQTNPSHPYGAAGTYNATATAQIGNYQIKSNPVTITVPAPTQVTPTYRITLKVQPQIVDVGEDVNANITVEPSPAPGTTYKFDWGDGKQEVRTVPNASHQYSVARKHAVHSTVTIDNQQFHSNPVAVTIKTPPVVQPEQPKPEPQPNRWPLIVGVVVAVVLLIAGYRLIRRGQKLPLPHLPHGLSITSKRGTIQHEIRNAEKIRKAVGVRIVPGCTSSTSMTPSGGIIKKRSASNA